MLGDEKTARQEGRRHTAKGLKSPLKSVSTSNTGDACAFGLINHRREVNNLHPANLFPARPTSLPFDADAGSKFTNN
jgi:hypothetical protein